jgi:antirestriction protein ArdC
LLEQLGDKVAALASSEQWLVYLRFVSAFRHYSFNNVLLIAAQCPHATRVAGYRKWQELGRQVRKGERAIKILGYSTKKITKTDPETGEEIEGRVPRYPVLAVFDISQTDGEPVPTEQLSTPDRGRSGRRARAARYLADR